jgi:hypothetical protein
VADRVRDTGAKHISTRDIKKEIDYHTHTVASQAKGTPTPAVEVAFGRLAEDIGKMLENDRASEKLEEIVKSMAFVLEDPKGEMGVKKITFALKLLGERSSYWKGSLEKSMKSPAKPKLGKLVALKQITGGN